MDGLIKELCKENGVEYSEELFREIYFRCSDLEVEDISVNIVACLDYVKDKGLDALINEMDDLNIWKYIC